MTDNEIRKIGLVDETIYTENTENKEKYFLVYDLDKTAPRKIPATRDNVREYRTLLIRYPSLMKHAKKGRTKIWNIN